MIVSATRIAANRRNAARSTGPRTAEGKERSRANALKHGLCASVVVIEDPEVIQARALEWSMALKPQNDYHIWLVDEVAVTSLRIDRAERIERHLRDKRSLQAELSWEDDRRLEATRLGASLSFDPEMVVEALHRTPQGCEWLMARWALLAHAADREKAWTPAQKRLAFDLMATPREFRDGSEPGTSLDSDGQVIAGPEDPAAVARREIAALKERRDAIEVLDETLRTLAASDLGDDHADPELRRLRRHEATLHTRLRWCLKQINLKSPYTHPRYVVSPSQPAQNTPRAVEPDPKPEASRPLDPWDHPPFDLTPDEYPEPGQVADIPAIIAARTEKKLKKAESRREARRRKLERMRSAS